jgi:hypothetical protein
MNDIYIYVYIIHIYIIHIYIYLIYISYLFWTPSCPWEGTTELGNSIPTHRAGAGTCSNSDCNCPQGRTGDSGRTAELPEAAEGLVAQWDTISGDEFFLIGNSDLATVPFTVVIPQN